MTATTRALVTVVIPCFSQARYLADAIGSTAAGDFPTEVIVVDDGPAGTAGLIAATFPGVRYIHQPNRGLAAAKNGGLASASGEFVIFLDPDDRLLPGAVDTGARALSGRRDCAIAYGRAVMMGPDGAIWPTPEMPTVRSGHHAALLRTNLIWMSGMAILRRDALDRAGGFRAGFDAAADYDLYLRLTSRDAACDHGQLVAAYRHLSESMSCDASRMLRDTLVVMRRNRPHDRLLQSAWGEGYHAWQEFYGTQLIDEIHAHLCARRPGPALRKGLALGRHAPHVLRRELAKKTRGTLQLRLRPGL